MGDKLAHSSYSQKFRTAGIFLGTACLMLEPRCKEKPERIVDEVEALSKKSDRDLEDVCGSVRQISAIGRIIRSSSPESLVSSFRESEARLKKLDSRLIGLDGGGLPGLVDRSDMCSSKNDLLDGQIFIMLPVLPKERDMGGELAKGMHTFRFLAVHEQESSEKIAHLRAWSKLEEPYTTGELNTLFKNLKN